METVAEMIATYKKHGWELRRILLSPGSKSKVGARFAVTFPGIKFTDSGVDAIWFSRSPTGGPVAWEIRYLGNTPFALVQTIDESAPDLESLLRVVEENLLASISAKNAA